MRNPVVRLLLLILFTLAGGAIAVTPASAGDDHDRDHGRGQSHTAGPEVISLPTGFRPEGIAVGRGSSFYVGSLADGAIYRGDLKTGEGAVLVPGVTGRAVTGVEVDHRNRLFAAGQSTGVGRVYDADSGAQLAEYTFVPAGTPTFLNDVVVTKRAAYFTDSVNPVLYVVPIGRHGELGAEAATLPLTGDLQYDADPATLEVNGIEASPDGRTLLVIQSRTGLLFAVDAKTGATTQVDLGGAVLPNGDGLLRKGKTLYVVQNRLNQIAPVRLNRSYTSGRVGAALTNENLDVPTTIGAYRGSLYAVNARFGTVDDPATADYTVVRVSTD